MTRSSTIDLARIKLPDFGLPLNHKGEHDDSFPNVVKDWNGKPLTERGLTMIKMMSQITNKPSWDQNVFDDSIAQEWTEEARDAENIDITDPMLD